MQHRLAPQEPRPNNYAGVRFDRLVERRGDAAWLAARLADPKSRFLPVWQTRNLVGDPGSPALTWIDQARAQALIERGAVPILLGQVEGQLYFGLDVSFLDTTDHEPALAGMGHFVDLRTVGPLLPPAPAALLASVKAYTQWHSRHRFCGVCGHTTRVEEAGHTLRCTNPACNAQHFPRTDPAVIMLVHDGGDRLVMGRQKVWPPGMHSVLAGFLEPGESLEDAVAREVKEEVGIEVADILYHSSQPWPFPGSLMLGFFARATDLELKVNTDELEMARWVTRDEVVNSPENEVFKLSRKDSISRRLVDDWLAATA